MESEVAKYLYELGQLKRVRRSGWWLAGLESPESVADHTFRAAAVAFVLALVEGANPERSAALALFHDSAETRLNDLHRVGKRYVDWESAEAQALQDQTSPLPDSIRRPIVELLEEYRSQRTLEARVARDADRLECLLQGCEYRERGASAAEEWIQSSQRELTTEAARKLAATCIRHGSRGWQRDP
jgi:putative hydrolase of HD superfamily